MTNNTITAQYTGDRKYDVLVNGKIVNLELNGHVMTGMTKRSANAASSYLSMKDEAGQLTVDENGNVLLSF